MAKKSLFCIATNEKQAIEIVQHLKVGGFQHDDISILFSDKQGNFAHQKETRAAPEGAAGANTSGGELGWLAGIGGLAIPGVGPFVAAGPIMAALSGAAAGATLAGITGALVGMGIPEQEARRYEGKIRKGNTLISVHSENNRSAEKAKVVFERAGAKDISSTSEVVSKGSKKGLIVERIEPPIRTGKRSITPAASAESSITSSSRTGKSNGGTPPATPKPESNQQPDTYTPTHEEIAARAQQIFLKSGSQHGRDVENWLEAEAQLKAERKAKMRRNN